MTNHPRIGIRPTIDGRRKGVRESLEEQTMNMAKSVAELFTSNLRYPDGSPVEVVIADTTIGRVHEAQACAAKFRANNVGLTLTVTPCWCYGTETTDMDPAMPHAIWGFNGTERPGAVTQSPVKIGYYTVKAAVVAINKGELPKVIDSGFAWYDKTNIDNADIKANLYE